VRRSVGLAFGACTLHLYFRSGGSFDCSALISACEYHTKTSLLVIGAVLSTASLVCSNFLRKRALVNGCLAQHSTT
jgi:hypothetical protein